MSWLTSDLDSRRAASFGEVNLSSAAPCAQNSAWRSAFSEGRELRDDGVIGERTGKAQVELDVSHLLSRGSVEQLNPSRSAEQLNPSRSTGESSGGNGSHAKAHRTGPSPVPAPVGLSSPWQASDCMTGKEKQIDARPCQGGHGRQKKRLTSIQTGGGYHFDR